MQFRKIFVVGILFASTAQAFGAKSEAVQRFEDDYVAWKNQPEERFAEGKINFEKVKEMLLKQHFNAKLTDEDLYRAATQGMLSALNPGSQTWNKLITPTELKEMEGDLKGEISGVGVEMKFDDATGMARIIRVLPGTAAENAGLKSGDQIVSVNGRLYKGLQFRDMVYDIRGKTGEKVKMKILRGDEIVSKTLTREKVAWEPVEWSLFPNGVGVLSVRYFSETTPRLLRRALTELQKEGSKGLVIDLRGNSGGLFEKAVESASLFLPKDSVVVKIIGRDKRSQEVKSQGEPMVHGIPVVILVNSETASGAELFSASLIDNLSAKVVGENTFGKWNSQELEMLSNGFAVKFTVKQFSSPKGRSYQNTGIQPDIQVSVAKESVARTSSKTKSAKERMEADVQLRAAVHLL